MHMKEFIHEDKNEIEKYIDEELDKIADCFYQLAHGFYDLSKTDSSEEYLKDFIADEFNREGGILKKYFHQIYKLEDNLQEFEEQIRKDDKDFNPDESMVTELKVEYQDLIREFSKKMFLYGVKFGSRLQRKI